MTSGLPIDSVLLLAFAFLAAGALLAGKSDRLRVPASLLFLGFGMLVGDDGLALVRFDDPQVTQNLGVLALLVILFEGGMTTRPSDLRQAALPGFVLANVGVGVTAGVVAVAVRLLLEADWYTALILGAVVSSTDAAAVFALLRRAPLPRRLGAMLEIESGTNDPFAIVLTIGLLSAWQASPTLQEWVIFGAVQLLGGLVVGALVGLAAVTVLRRVSLGAVTLYPVLALAMGGLAYASAASVGASGFLAVYVAGLFVGALVPRHRRAIRNFHTSLANTAEIGLFLLLGLLVFPSRLLEVAPVALAVTAILIVLARPLGVFLSLLPFRIGWREQVIASWAGLRGAVPIVLSTFPFTLGYPAGETIFNVVFFVVLASILVQGTTVAALVDRLGLTTPRAAWQPIAEAIPLEGVETDLVELVVTPDLAVAGRTLGEVPLPAGLLVTSILRGNAVLLPSGATMLEPGDLAVIALSRQHATIQDVTEWARGESLGSSRGEGVPGPGGSLAEPGQEDG